MEFKINRRNKIQRQFPTEISKIDKTLSWPRKKERRLKSLNQEEKWWHYYKHRNKRDYKRILRTINAKK